MLHSFAGPEGSYPMAGLVGDAAGNLYEVTSGDIQCTYGCGTVFKLDTGGKVTLLYAFKGGTDGAQPYGGLVRDAEGNLYGTTLSGGNPYCPSGCGIVFEVDATGTETKLYTFTGRSDGALPFDGLVRDAAGNLYGTASAGGTFPLFGVVFKLDPAGRETVLYNFTGGTDGGSPYSGLIRTRRATYTALLNLVATCRAPYSGPSPGAERFSSWTRPAGRLCCTASKGVRMAQLPSAD